MACYYRTNCLLSANLKDNLQERSGEGNVEPVVNAAGALPGRPLSDRAAMPLPRFPEHTWEVMPSPGSRSTAHTGCRGAGLLPTGRTTLGCYSRFRAPCGIRLRLDLSWPHIFAWFPPAPRFHPGPLNPSHTAPESFSQITAQESLSQVLLLGNSS